MSESIQRWKKPIGNWQIQHCLPIATQATGQTLNRWQRIWQGLKHHPDQTPMDERAFHRYCLDARFPSQAGKLGKCPC